MPIAQTRTVRIAGILKATAPTLSIRGTERRIHYCEKPGKAAEIVCINCRDGCFMDETEITRAFYRKNDGRMLYQYIFSMPPGMSSIEEVKAVAVRLVKENPLFDGFEVEIAIHTDADHLHAHILVNSVCAADGHKFEMSTRQYRDWVDQMKVILREYGYEPVKARPKERGDFSSRDRNKYEVVNRKGVDADIVRVYQAVDVARHEACSWEDFETRLISVGIAVERSEKRKHIVFGYQGRRYRDSNLSRTFTDTINKEALENEFLENERRRSEEYEHDRARQDIVADLERRKLERSCIIDGDPAPTHVREARARRRELTLERD